ncbi:hypothetical protein [Thermogymnomonas acidicola]|uniref:hypothetical protein n=1 Tax=Thermogymnomonas acidicola TaxID=399579 RepID=UPI001494C7D8|nr:hypothetical protein [Thermogymnomonas acidicola]
MSSSRWYMNTSSLASPPSLSLTILAYSSALALFFAPPFLHLNPEGTVTRLIESPPKVLRSVGIPSDPSSTTTSILNLSRWSGANVRIDCITLESAGSTSMLPTDGMVNTTSFETLPSNLGVA